MKWLAVSFDTLSDSERQVDEVVRTYDTLNRQLQGKYVSNEVQITKALRILGDAVQARIPQLEAFYLVNDLDPRAQRVEAMRLKLKQMLKRAGIELPVRAPGAVLPHAGGYVAASAAPSSKPAAGAGASLPGGALVAPPRDGDNADGNNNGTTITLRLHMTNAEFEELRVRRDAMRQLLHRGDGRLAWEAGAAAAAARGVDASREGVYTAGDSPFTDNSAAFVASRAASRGRADPLGRPAFDASGKPRSPPRTFLGSNQPYRDPGAARLDPAGVQQQQQRQKGPPFQNVLGRTRITTTLDKVQSVGSHR